MIFKWKYYISSSNIEVQVHIRIQSLCKRRKEGGALIVHITESEINVANTYDTSVLRQFGVKSGVKVKLKNKEKANCTYN